MSTLDSHDGQALAEPSSPPADPTPTNQEAHGPSRAELRAQALSSRNRYVLGDLPSEEHGAEIDNALHREIDEESSLGVAFKFLVVDDIPDEERIGTLQEHFGHASPGSSVGLRQHLDALRFGIFPQGPSMARNIAARMRSILRRHEFSQSTRALLERNVAALEDIASDTDAYEAEQHEAEIKEQSQEDKLNSRAGVYVFTYPHYLRHPTHPSPETEKMPDRTLLKVGYTEGDILERVNQETRGAGIPEHRRVLRAYLVTADKGGTAKDFERTFHNMLDTAGHAGPKRGSVDFQRGGNEWFFTSIEFLDQIAKTLDLETIEFDTPDY